MRMEHFDIVLEHIGGALRDLDVSEVQIFPTMAIPLLHFHPQMSKGPLLEGFTSGTLGSLITPALDVLFNCEIKVEDSYIMQQAEIAEAAAVVETLRPAFQEAIENAKQ